MRSTWEKIAYSIFCLLFAPIIGVMFFGIFGMVLLVPISLIASFFVDPNVVVDAGRTGVVWIGAILGVLGVALYLHDSVWYPHSSMDSRTEDA